ncbi:muconolactone Delta-isomerase family protein [Amycolatopsis sp. NPDC024027]|uniref:muconolactone Delta-isomerase family protein n=1 Tax=Amycolatopsis sp. NPDC024027 TaxID=3154327 RepID=UPI0033F6DC79
MGRRLRRRADRYRFQDGQTTTRASFSVFEVESNDELHDLLSALPLMSSLDISVTALARHPFEEDREKTGRPSNQV